MRNRYDRPAKDEINTGQQRVVSLIYGLNVCHASRMNRNEGCGARAGRLTGWPSTAAMPLELSTPGQEADAVPEARAALRVSIRLREDMSRLPTDAGCQILSQHVPKEC